MSDTYDRAREIMNCLSGTFTFKGAYGIRARTDLRTAITSALLAERRAAITAMTEARRLIGFATAWHTAEAARVLERALSGQPADDGRQ